MVTMRQFEPGDLDALYAISMATGHHGADASHLYADQKLMGHIYAAPYAVLEPDLALVVEDGDGVAGFVVGVPDTVLWEATLERRWWPMLRHRYSDPGDTPAATWTPDQRRAFIIHHPTRTPPAVVHTYPAHLHMNLLPRAQGRGIGTRLLNAWFDIAGSRKASPAHVGINKSNRRAIGFWEKHGFKDLMPGDDPSGRTIWMGRP